MPIFSFLCQTLFSSNISQAPFGQSACRSQKRSFGGGLTIRKKVAKWMATERVSLFCLGFFFFICCSKENPPREAREGERRTSEPKTEQRRTRRQQTRWPRERTRQDILSYPKQSFPQGERKRTKIFCLSEVLRLVLFLFVSQQRIFVQQGGVNFCCSYAPGPVQF